MGTRYAVMRTTILVGLLILLSGLLLQGGDHDCPAYPASKWSFNAETLAERGHTQHLVTKRLAASVPDAANAASLTKQNFVDDYILAKLNAEGVQPAGLATDAEFMRRITLDLTGRPPDSDRLFAFVADQSSNKRRRLVDDVLYSVE